MVLVGASTIYRWRFAVPSSVRETSAPDGVRFVAAALGDSGAVLTADTSGVLRLHAPALEHPQVVGLHQAARRLAFSHDETAAASGAADGVVHLWDARPLPSDVFRQSGWRIGSKSPPNAIATLDPHSQPARRRNALLARRLAIVQRVQQGHRLGVATRS